MSTFIHPTAIVKTQKIGKDVEIGAFSIIDENVSIGDGSKIGDSVLLTGDTIIGKNNIIYHGASIGTPPQDLHYNPNDEAKLIIGNNNTIREFATINLSTNKEKQPTEIGNNCLLMAYSHVAHNCKIGDEVILANSVNLAGHVHIDDYVIIGGMTPVHQFVSIGKYAFIGGASRLSKDAIPFMKFAGNPIYIVGTNAIGLQRRGFNAERIKKIKLFYKTIFRSGMLLKSALGKLNEDYPNDADLKMIIEFIANSRRGIERKIGKT